MSFPVSDVDDSFLSVPPAVRSYLRGLSSLYPSAGSMRLSFPGVLMPPYNRHVACGRMSRSLEEAMGEEKSITIEYQTPEQVRTRAEQLVGMTFPY